jgi:hypothetical protein
MSTIGGGDLAARFMALSANDDTQNAIKQIVIATVEKADLSPDKLIENVRDLKNWAGVDQDKLSEIRTLLQGGALDADFKQTFLAAINPARAEVVADVFENDAADEKGVAVDNPAINAATPAAASTGSNLASSGNTLGFKVLTFGASKKTEAVVVPAKEKEPEKPKITGMNQPQSDAFISKAKSFIKTSKSKANDQLTAFNSHLKGVKNIPVALLGLTLTKAQIDQAFAIAKKQIQSEAAVKPKVEVVKEAFVSKDITVVIGVSKTTVILPKSVLDQVTDKEIARKFYNTLKDSTSFASPIGGQGVKLLTGNTDQDGKKLQKGEKLYELKILGEGGGARIYGKMKDNVITFDIFKSGH